MVPANENMSYQIADVTQTSQSLAATFYVLNLLSPLESRQLSLGISTKNCHFHCKNIIK